MHDLRKTFAQLAYLHFNERGSVLPAFASTVLGHKRPLSKRIMTYLIIRTVDMPSLETIFALAKVGLRPDKAEEHEVLVESVRDAPLFATPPNSSSDEGEDKGENVPDELSTPVVPAATHRDAKYGFDRKGRAVRLRTVQEIQGAMDAL